VTRSPGGLFNVKPSFDLPTRVMLRLALATAGLAPGLHAVGGYIIGLCGDGGVIAVHRLLAGAHDVDAMFLNFLQHATSEPTASP
jgi:hypothetical protein